MKTEQTLLVLILMLFTKVALAQEINSDFFQVDENVGLTEQQISELSGSFEEAQEQLTLNELSEFRLNQLQSVLTDYQFVVHLRNKTGYDADRMTQEMLHEIANLKSISFEEAKSYERKIHEYYYTVAMAQKRYVYDEEKLRQNLKLLWDTAPLIVKEVEMKKQIGKEKGQESRAVGVDYYKNQYHW